MKEDISSKRKNKSGVKYVDVEVSCKECLNACPVTCAKGTDVVQMRL